MDAVAISRKMPNTDFIIHVFSSLPKEYAVTVEIFEEKLYDYSSILSIKTIQEKLNAAINKIILNKDVKERLLALGMESPQLNLEAFNKVFLADRDLMTRIVKETGITRDS